MNEHDLANRVVELAADKERLIYWLLCMVRDAGWIGDVERGASACLADLDYVYGSDRARRMLELGEPGLHLTKRRDD